MIAFEHVSKRYGEQLALDEVSWAMGAGECVTLLGPSAAGKTTCIRLITHEEQPTSGQVMVGSFGPGRLRRRHRALLRRMLGIVYEDFHLLADRTVYENVALALRIAGRFAEEDVIPHVVYALEEVGLPHRQRAYPDELSGGEKQRVALARAIVNRPAVILADEPTGKLERKSRGEVLGLLRRLHQEGTALLLATTSEEVAAAFPGRTLRLVDGRLAGENGAPSIGGTPEARWAAPAAPVAAPTPTAADATPPAEAGRPAALPAPPPEPAGATPRVPEG
jgi:cell division transport system ATP-binding protein